MERQLQFVSWHVCQPQRRPAGEGSKKTETTFRGSASLQLTLVPWILGMVTHWLFLQNANLLCLHRPGLESWLRYSLALAFGNSLYLLWISVSLFVKWSEEYLPWGLEVTHIKHTSCHVVDSHLMAADIFFFSSIFYPWRWWMGRGEDGPQPFQTTLCIHLKILLRFAQLPVLVMLAKCNHEIWTISNRCCIVIKIPRSAWVCVRVHACIHMRAQEGEIRGSDNLKSAKNNCFWKNLHKLLGRLKAKVGTGQFREQLA